MWSSSPGFSPLFTSGQSPTVSPLPSLPLLSMPSVEPLSLDGLDFESKETMNDFSDEDNQSNPLVYDGDVAYLIDTDFSTQPFNMSAFVPVSLTPPLPNESPMPGLRE